MVTKQGSEENHAQALEIAKRSHKYRVRSNESLESAAALCIEIAMEVRSGNASIERLKDLVFLVDNHVKSAEAHNDEAMREMQRAAATLFYGCSAETFDTRINYVIASAFVGAFEE